MKFLITLLVLLATVLLSNAQINNYSHFVAGGYNRAGYRIANEFAKWDTKNNRFVDLPQASFGGGSVSDISPAGNGFLVVGDFTTINGNTANGIAYYDGAKWCAYPHLNLYYYPKPFPQDTKFPRAASANAVAGSAVSIYASDATTYYVFGGRMPGAFSRTRFNQVGSVYSGVAGLVRLKFDGTSNFTVDNTLNYETQGVPNEPSTNGFPADSGYGAPSTTVGATKLRVINAGGFLSFYVHPNLGSGSNLYRWRQGDGAWLQVTQTTGGPGFVSFNVSGSSAQFSITAQRLGSNIYDFDVDVPNNVVFVAGSFDNTNNATANVQYLHVACSNNAHSGAITWQKAVNWANNNNFNNAGQFASAITVVNQNLFYVAIPFQSIDSNDALFGVNQYCIFSVTSMSPAVLGGRFAKSDGSPPKISKVAYYNTLVYAFGDFGLINYIIDQTNLWPRRFTRKISGAVCFDSSKSDWVDSYGGFTPTTGSLPGYANVAGYDYLWYKGATSFYDSYSSGSLVAYNTKTNKWDNMAKQRFTIRDGSVGTDGAINAVHFIKKQRNGVTDAVLVGGQFDWFGTQYLGSIAFLRTNGLTFEQLGGGVYLDESGFKYSGDQVTPIYRAGTVMDIEEIDNNFYVGGTFAKNINGKCLGNIASVPVNGGTFESLGNGCDGTVYDMLANGNLLYVGGDFNTCNGIPGTRRIAAWDTKKSTFSPLSTGFADGRVFAMIMWKGNLLVGGSFTTAPASYRYATGVTGLYQWDTKKWTPLTGKCENSCDTGVFTSPFSFGDPLARSVSQVKSLRTIGSDLYIQAQVSAGTTQYLVQYDGSLFRQYGSATGNAGCSKQGCLASNQSNILGAGFSRNQGTDNYNNNYLCYNRDYKNWVDTYTGFDNAPVIIASANLISFTIMSLILVVFIAL